MPDAEARRLVGLRWLTRTTRRASGHADSHSLVLTCCLEEEFELRRGRMRNADSNSDGTASRITVGRASVPDDGEPLSQKGKTGGGCRRGAIQCKRPAGHDAK